MHWICNINVSLKQKLFKFLHNINLKYDFILSTNLKSSETWISRRYYSGDVSNLVEFVLLTRKSFKWDSWQIVLDLWRSLVVRKSIIIGDIVLD